MALWIIYGSFDGSKFIKLTHRPVEASAIDDFLNYYPGWSYFAWPAAQPMAGQLVDAIDPEIVGMNLPTYEALGGQPNDQV